MIGKQPLTNRDASGRVHCSYSHILHMNKLARQNTLIDDPDQSTQASTCRDPEISELLDQRTLADSSAALAFNRDQSPSSDANNRRWNSHENRSSRLMCDLHAISNPGTGQLHRFKILLASPVRCSLCFSSNQTSSLLNALTSC